MYSEEKLIRGFENLLDIEVAARKVYEELRGKLIDRELIEFTTWLVKAEEHHKVLVEEALALIRED